MSEGSSTTQGSEPRAPAVIETAGVARKDGSTARSSGKEADDREVEEGYPPVPSEVAESETGAGGVTHDVRGAAGRLTG